MARYRKRPVVVEAFQMTLVRRWDNSGWPAWLHAAWDKDRDEPGALRIDHMDHSGNRLEIVTLEGVHAVGEDDWIIQGVAGELYPCKPEIFAATYDVVEDG